MSWVAVLGFALTRPGRVLGLAIVPLSATCQGFLLSRVLPLSQHGLLLFKINMTKGAQRHLHAT